MRVGEVAERAGVNVETLRYYERRGLLPEPERLPSGHRRYDEETVRFLRAIKEAQSVGFTLAEIGDYLGAARRFGSPSETLQRADGREDRRDRRADRRPEADAERARAGRRLRVRLPRPLHVRGRVSRSPRTGDERAAGVLHVTNGESAGNSFGRPGSAERSYPGRTSSMTGRCRTSGVRSSCKFARTSSQSAAGGAAARSARRSSDESASFAQRCGTGAASCSGSSTISTTSSSCSMCSHWRTASGARWNRSSSTRFPASRRSGDSAS